MTEPDGTTFFFMHIMKTAGTSFARHLHDRFPPEVIYPSPGAPPAQHQEHYWKIAPLRELEPQARAEFRLFHGHLPLLVQDLVEPDVTLTILRDPVERTISHIRHCQRHFPAHSGKSDEAVYDDDWLHPLFFRNYQIKQFALTTADNPKAHNEDIIIDAAREEIALTGLERVDLFGLTDRYGEFLEATARRFRWRVGTARRLQVAPASAPVSAALRQRIVADNTADIEFYRLAVDRYEAGTR